MSQRFQPVFYFLSALFLALLFFLPFASFYGDFHTFDLFGYGVTSPDNWDNGASPFSLTFSLPILILTITAMVLGGYLAMGLFRAVKLAQFQKLLKKAGLEHHRVHDLRHTFAVNSLRAGDDIKTLQENMGHYSAAFTLDRYGHVTEEMRKASSERMQKFIDEMNGEN